MEEMGDWPLVDTIWTELDRGFANFVKSCGTFRASAFPVTVWVLGRLFDDLALVYRSWLVHGTVTASLLACAFLPLLKSSLKDSVSTDSYRVIACSSLLLKFSSYLTSVFCCTGATCLLVTASSLGTRKGLVQCTVAG